MHICKEETKKKSYSEPAVGSDRMDCPARAGPTAAQTILGSLHWAGMGDFLLHAKGKKKSEGLLGAFLGGQPGRGPGRGRPRPSRGRQ